MGSSRKRSASDDSPTPSEPEASKRVQRSEKPSRPSFLGGKTMVTVNVSNDQDKDKFLVHKDFICHYSPFFDAAFNGNFEEGERQEMDFPGTKPVVFGIFVEWLYSQKVTCPLKTSTRTLSLIY
ncbi:hypothetical protein LSUE1_G009221 [Lachnellula suecica]|uniref:BTB domain-containing protein n=1 Tax=Lachnellula suecica TaxID=602035 RepID=A0A8T9BTJ2_9HELO|nr:hypothetical protein LSUE1_G009221 [Lachnellula suecica]